MQPYSLESVTLPKILAHITQVIFMIIPRSNAARGDFSVGYTRLKNCVPKSFRSYVFLRNLIFCLLNQFLLNQCCTLSIVHYANVKKKLEKEFECNYFKAFF